MTTELQRAMARYEEARGRYKKAVLASMTGARGDAIRDAIAEFQSARADLTRLQPPPRTVRATPARPAAAPAKARGGVPAWSFVAKLLNAG